MGERRKIFYNILESADAAIEVKKNFKKRIKESNFSKNENEFSHFCVYFPAYDPVNKLIFIGRHKKSGLWLLNGGHMETNETPADTLKREIAEEWGIEMDVSGFAPKMLTVTEIVSNPAKRPCKTHYDIWFFIPQDSKIFAPDPDLLAVEFYESGWKTFDEARSLSKDANTIASINEMEKQHENR